MQLLERSAFGLRSAVHELSSPRYGVRLLLIPMVHIADAAFYASVNDRLDRCGSVIIEGVRSFRVRLLTMSYKIPARRKSLGLTLQKNEIRLAADKVIHGDVGGEEFALSWAVIPWYERISLLFLAPLVGVALYLVASRQWLVRGPGVDSLSNQSVVSSGESSWQYEKAVIQDRDRHLLECIEKHILADPDRQQLTAVLFGGRHMPAIAGVLMSKYGYRVSKSEWLTAIAL